MNYSYEDAKQDAISNMTDFNWLFDNWLNVRHFQNSIMRKPSAVTNTLSEHIDNLQLLEFSNAIINSELSRLNSDYNKVEVIDTNKDNNKYNQSMFNTVHDVYTSLPFSAKLHDVIDNDSHAKYDSNHISLKQLTRDIQRDRVIINGRRLVGANVGLEGVLLSLGDTIDYTFAHCLLPPLSSQLKDEICVNIMKSASRTNSGGLSFQMLTSLFNTDNILLVPHSSLAGSLLIKISIGNFNNNENDSNGANNWGFKCEIMVSTFFKLQDSGAITHDDMNDNNNEIHQKHKYNKTITNVNKDNIDIYDNSCIEVQYKNLLYSEINRDINSSEITKMNLKGMSGGSGEIIILHRKC